MVNVDESVSAILMCCDESISGINLGGGYTIQKVYFSDLPFKANIVDGRGIISTDYYFSRLYDQTGDYYMCISKTDTFAIRGPVFDGKTRIYTDEDIACESELAVRTSEEFQFLNDRINLLRLFHEGNIGFRTVFFQFKHQALGITNTLNRPVHIQTRNTVDSRIYSLTPDEIRACNAFLSMYAGSPYDLLKDCIDVFSWGLEQIDVATGFEKYTTALEMTLLESNQQGKKQALANRVSVILGKTNSEIQTLHQKMTDFYRYRSESLHEGNGSNISEIELRELERIVRSVLSWYLEQIRLALLANPTATWAEIKKATICNLVAKVTQLKAQSILP